MILATLNGVIDLEDKFISMSDYVAEFSGTGNTIRNLKVGTKTMTSRHIIFGIWKVTIL